MCDHSNTYELPEETLTEVLIYLVCDECGTILNTTRFPKLERDEYHV
jgi:hypothetical protein